MSKIRIYNKILCPNLWDKDQKLKLDIRKNLLKIAKDFYDKMEFKAPIKDIYLMGSSANYNWSPNSDLDLHILIDFKQLQMPIDTAKQMAKTSSSQWNNEHDIIIKGHEVEINIQDISDSKPHVTGIYSLIKNDWVRKPSILPVEIDRLSIIDLYNKLKNYIEKAIQTNDRVYMKSVKDYIDSFRQYGLDTVGEMGNENIVFKILRSKGIIKKLKDKITSLYDKELSLKEKTFIQNEVIDRDIKSTSPKETFSFLNIPYEKLTLDNLKSLRNSMGRFMKHSSDRGIDKNQLQKMFNIWDEINNEIKSRIDYINKPAIENEGYGAGKPEEDSKMLKGRRWTVRYDSSSKMLRDGFDPTSMGPNPEATEGQSNPNYYKDQIYKMRKKGVHEI